MRHCKHKGRLSRRTAWRKATLKSLTNDLFTYQRIETTEAKAKALRVFAEPLITLAKNNPTSVNAKRMAFSKLCNKTVVKSLFDNIAPLYKDIPGGYTRIMQVGNRKGDGARVVIVELTKRTISDDKLLGISQEKKQKTKSKKKTDEKSEKTDKPKGKAKTKSSAKNAKEAEVKTEKAHAAPEVVTEEKSHIADEKIKERAKAETKKTKDKGIFKRFRRKSIG